MRTQNARQTQHTQKRSKSIAAALFGKSRRAILALLFGRTERPFYLREIARSAGAAVGSVQRELANLVEAGIVRRSVQGAQVYFQANPDCPVYPELRSLMTKTAGVADVLRDALEPLQGNIALAFVYGSVARGEERSGSDIDLMVLGDASFAEVAAAVKYAEKELGREINPSVFPFAEFSKKRKARNHFIRTVLAEEKLFIIGNEDAIDRLA
jgi:predicted nucleotidyltransferase